MGPADGNAIGVPGVSAVTVEEKGITHRQDHWDQQAVAEQRGLTFPYIVPKLPGIVAAKLRATVQTSAD